MWPVNLVSVASSLLVLFMFYRRDIPPVYDESLLKAPQAAIVDHATFRMGWWVLGWLLVGFFGLDRFGVPISLVAGIGAAALYIVAMRGQHIDTHRVLRHAPWQIVVFSLGMYLVVFGLRNAGLTDIVGQWLSAFAQHGVWGAAFGTGLLVAGLSAVMNNMPTVLVGALSIDASHAEGATRLAMIYANVIGSDLGPKLTPIGSLATLLWLHVLARKNIRIGWGYYMRIGVVLTLPVLLATLAALAIRLSF